MSDNLTDLPNDTAGGPIPPPAPAGQAEALFADLPVEVTVSVGRARPSISALLALRPDSVVALDKSIDDPVDIFVGDRLIAQGTLEEIGEDGQRQLAVRLTHVPGLAESR